MHVSPIVRVTAGSGCRCAVAAAAADRNFETLSAKQRVRIGMYSGMA